IHALVGENGAGKSTLMLIMAGVHQPNGGELLLDGQPIKPRNPHHAQQLGISTVFQDLALAPNMSVAENVYTNCQPTHGPGLITFNSMYQSTAQALQEFGVEVNPRAPLRQYNVAIQQLVEIARATHRQARVLILDEPTSAIGGRETERLFQILRMLRERGLGIIYVSHKLDEVFALSDRITVLKDGKLVGTTRTLDTSPETVVRMMVGRELSQLVPAMTGERGAPTLEVRNLSGHGFSNVSLTAYAGEVLGIFGLTGAGRTELARAIFAIDPIKGGEILFQGRPAKISDPNTAMELGIAYIPEDRKRDGLFLEMSLRQNVAAACLKAVSGRVFMNPGKEEALARDAIGTLQIKTSGLGQRASRLSGGNQQKVLFAKWLARHPKVLIADEPTRGIDVGSKAEVHALLRKLANEGAAVVMISSELPEVVGMSDRIAVMREGRLAGIFPRDGATEEIIASHALGATEVMVNGAGGDDHVR
ncbi:MAG TPA: sugar ABC transporter ATP-binding protein, partial [Chloroflexota bacterium]|nr:sugar ABC transporter ATP-binding protein [Chloroflexota bacterium]